MIRREFGDHLPMTREEAEQHRLGLMTTRTAFGDQAKSNWKSVAYSFCEHWQRSKGSVASLPLRKVPRHGTKMQLQVIH